MVTADRPAEMRACASGQTIDQQKIFGSHVVFQHEMPVPEASPALLRYLRQTLAHAFGRSLGPDAGPVHLNAPFRDPLVPEPGAPEVPGLEAWDWNAFFGEIRPPGPPPSLPAHVEMEGPGVIVAGPAQPADPGASAREVGRLAAALGWPVLADALSPLRQHASVVPGLVTTYDAILRSPGAAARLRPAAVLCLGSWPTSKVLRAWITAADPRITMLSGRPENRDALHGRTVVVDATPGSLTASLAGGVAEGGFAAGWAACEARARAVLDGRIGLETRMFEPKAAWLLAANLPPGTPIFIASSMPVRDAETTWPAGDRGLRPFFNRGANGIDGTLSSALGCAHGGPPAVLLTGDLALLHDTNGFLDVPRLKGSLTIVLINNRGGGIFGHLPVAREEAVFEEFFAMPQQVDFGRLASAYGVEHVRVRDWAHFTELVRTLPGRGVRILEVEADRRLDATARRELFAAAAAACQGTGAA